MPRIRTENGDTLHVVPADRSGTESGVHFEIEGAGAHWLTTAEARRIAAALTAVADKVDGRTT